ncbi:MAG: ABC transporter permease subunit [Dorea sp.]|nr:ABC transporter permease subunit [Dorea sp.]
MTLRILRELSAEQRKIRRRKIWLVPSGFLLFESFWMTWQLSNAHEEELMTGYLLLFYALPIMNTIIMPTMIAVIASRICDMEIKGNTLKLLYTLQKPSGFFDCKYLSGLKYLFFFTLGHGILILTAGNIFRFGEPLKTSMLAAYLAVTFCTGMILLTAQQTLSLLSNSQMMPLVIGLAGSFLGLFSLFFPAPLARLVIWGYFAAFPCVRMDWDRTSRITDYYEVPFPLQEFLVFAVSGILIYIICRTISCKKEV